MTLTQLNEFQPVPTVVREQWVSIPCHTLCDAVKRAIETTGNWSVSFSGDFGQDEGANETGMGNDDFAIIVWPNGTAILTVREKDNERYLKG